VPHSTLEYKVKERHLLRQKKIKEQKEAAARAAGKGSTIMNHSSNSYPSPEFESLSSAFVCTLCCNFLSNSEAGVLKAYPDEPKKLVSDAPPRLEDVNK
jgi:hypothetical protein